MLAGYNLCMTALLPSRTRWTSFLMLCNALIYGGLLLWAIQAQAQFGSSENAYLWALHSGWKSNAALANGDYWRLLSAIFLHTGWRHLATNLLFLWLFGRLVEPWLGGLGLVTLYVLSGVLGMLASYLFTPDASVGASGAIFGLIGAYTVIMIRHRKDIDSYIIPRLLYITVFLLFQFWLGTRSASIDGWSHLGGFCTGALLAWLWRRQLISSDRRLAQSQSASPQ